MSKKNNIVITCEEAHHICDKIQYKEASSFQRFRLFIHVIYCSTCKKFTKTNIKLTKRIKESKLECLDEKCKEAMKITLQKAINETLD